MKCKMCEAITSESWSKVVIQPACHDAMNDQSPYPWVSEGQAVEYFFDTAECRTAWLEKVDQ